MVELGDGARTPRGLVRLSAPYGAYQYWRLEWRDVEGRRQQTSGTKDPQKAWLKALRIEEQLVAGSTPKTSRKASELIAYWLDPSRPRPRRRPWGDSHARTMSDYATWYLLPVIGKVRCQDLRRSHLQRCVDAAPNADQGERVRRALVSLLRAGRQGEWLLPAQDLHVQDLHWHGQQAGVEATEAVEDTRYVEPSARPSHAQVEALAKAAGQVGRGVWWRELMVYLAAYTGCRQGELWALTADDVDPDRRTVRVHHQVVEVRGKGQQLAPPKMQKRRTTLFRATTPTGYNLQGALRRRVEEVRTEQAAGGNPKGLLFPGRGGSWLRTGNFHRDVFEPAAAAAGWSSRLDVQPCGPGRTRKVRVWDHTWHDLRHVFCSTALEEWGLAVAVVADLAGHKDAVTTMRLYVGNGDDMLARALDVTG